MPTSSGSSCFRLFPRPPAISLILFIFLFSTFYLTMMLFHLRSFLATNSFIRSLCRVFFISVDHARRRSDKETFLVSACFLSLFFLLPLFLLFSALPPHQRVPFVSISSRWQQHSTFPKHFHFIDNMKKTNKTCRLMCGILLCILLCAKCCTVQSRGRKEKRKPTKTKTKQQ